MNIKIARLLKPLFIVSSIALTSLACAYSYASDSTCNEKSAYKTVQTHVFPTSQSEGNYRLIFSKNNVKKLNTVPNELINSPIKIKKLTNLSMISNMHFVLIPNHEETYFHIKQVSKGNKLFEIATLFNDKLQLILNKFKQLFIAKNNVSTNNAHSIKSSPDHLTS